MFKLILCFTVIFFITPSSFAYLGPGVGGGIIAASVGILIAIIATIFGIIWFPLKRFLKKRKEKKEKYQNKID